MSFVPIGQPPGSGNMSFFNWLKDFKYIEHALKLPGENWLHTFEDLSQKDQDELLEQARKEMAI